MLRVEAAMKKLLVVLIWVSLTALAQSPPQNSNAPAQTPEQSRWKAPAPGHPLDPADVAILTGKANGAARPAGYAYSAYPAYAPGWQPNWFGTPLFTPVTNATRPPFGPIFFQRRNSVFVFGGSNPIRFGGPTRGHHRGFGLGFKLR
jgi:hypothetical protein